MAKKQVTTTKNGTKPERKTAACAGTKAAVKPKTTTERKEPERVTGLRRLIYLLKRLIGYRKGERDEFLFNLDTNHPNYIFHESNGKKRGVGITHEDSTFDKKNMPLTRNPDAKDERAAYVRNGIVVGKRYGKKPLKKMQFAPADKANVKSKVRNYKKRVKKMRSNNKKSK